MNIRDLVQSPLNARQSYIQETVTDLAECIREHGLIHPLEIHEHGDGKYGVLAGGRRKAALLFLHGPDYELLESEYHIFKGDDFAALSIGLIDQTHCMNFSSMELGRAASLLKDNKPKISHDEIAKILWTSKARVKRVLELLKDTDILPDAVREELSVSDSEDPSFTDSHWDKLKGTALDLSDAGMVKDVCDYIMGHDVPPSKVTEVVNNLLKKQEKEAGEDGEAPAKKEKPKDPNLIGEDEFNGYLSKDSDGSWVIKGKDGDKPFDPHYYTRNRRLH